MTTLVRGQTAYVTVVFTDKDGATVSPASASLYVSYCVSGVATTSSAISMSSETDGWVGSWDTSVADPGIIYWWAQSSDSPKSATEGSFILEANSANPEP